MSKKLILLFSHKLTDLQITDAQTDLGITEFIYLPDDLQNLWSNIPPDIVNLRTYLLPIEQWLNDITNKNDHILIQGDFGATHYFVNWAFKSDLTPIYSTTKRMHTEKKLKDGTIEINKSFSHQMFRKYYN